MDVIRFLHIKAQEEDVSKELQKGFSEDVAKHVIEYLIAAGTVVEFNGYQDSSYYLLVRMSYSPFEDKARTYVVVEDTARHFRLLRNWQRKQPGTMRILEVLDVLPEQLDYALEELDNMVCSWADKYHNKDGIPTVFQAIIGANDDDL